MNATTQSRLAALALAVVTSVSVLSATVVGMQPRTSGQSQLVALDSVTVTAVKVN